MAAKDEADPSDPATPPPVHAPAEPAADAPRRGPTLLTLAWALLISAIGGYAIWVNVNPVAHVDLGPPVAAQIDIARLEPAPPAAPAAEPPAVADLPPEPAAPPAPMPEPPPPAVQAAVPPPVAPSTPAPAPAAAPTPAPTPTR